MRLLILIVGLLVGCATGEPFFDASGSWCPPEQQGKTWDRGSVVTLACETDPGVLVGAAFTWDKETARPSSLVDFDGMGNLHGRTLTWHKNGRLRSEGEYFHGSQEGEMRMWHENGTPAVSAQYSNDQLEGAWIQWRPDGQLHLLRHLQHGKRNGPFFVWHENGRVKTMGYFSQGEELGEWKHWRADGTPDPEAAKDQMPAAIE